MTRANKSFDENSEKISEMSKKIAIIGCGVSGLAAIKSCLDEGLTPVCFERSDNIGGLWRYTEKVTEGQSCVMKSTVINTSKEIMSFSDFPMPEKYPMFMHNTQVQEYLESFAKHFNTTKYTKFRTEVMKMSQAENFEKTGQWELVIKDHVTGATTNEIFDGAMVCSGHHAEPNMPNFEGQDKFKGEIIHTHNYRSHVGYEDKRVVVVGIGNSGCDVLIELSRIAKQTYLSTRRGAWIQNRIGPKGMPIDMLTRQRWFQDLRGVLPRSFFNNYIEGKMNAKFDHALYGLKPQHRFDAQHPTGGDDLPNRLASGAAVVKPNIRRFTENGVEFVDGTVVDIDVVVFATGYVFGFPFIQHKAMQVEKNEVNLYKYVFPPDIQPATLAVIGCLQPLGSIIPLIDLQCRWVSRVFSGSCSLASPEAMQSEIHSKREAMRRRYTDSQRHTIQVEYIQYQDEIAELVGCKPNLKQLWLSDPRLAAKVYFGPSVPYQYRLMGPGQWTGAREAIMTAWDRTLFSFESGRFAPAKRESSMLAYIVGVAILCILAKLLFL